MRLLAEAHRVVQATGWTLFQCDITVIAQAPKLAPHVPAMTERLAQVLQVSIDQVSIKAKTNEGMGFIGRGEGIAVLAAATLVPLPPRSSPSPLLA
jgi:2-C-methyl-D-erythritol 2,4-cyclodiphosphate synthase